MSSALVLAGCGSRGVAPSVANSTTAATTSSSSTAATSSTASTTSTTTTTSTSTVTTRPAATTTQPAATTTLPATTTSTSRPATSTTALASATVITRGSSASPRIALTFDGGSDDGNVASIVATLQAKGVPGSFFLTGAFARAFPGSVAAVAGRGPVYSHTYGHPDLTTLTPAQALAEITRGAAAVEAVTRASVHPFFRPPYGAQNAMVNQVLAQAGFAYNVLWTVDSRGWQGVPPAQVLANVLAGSGNGAIVAMHLGSGSTDAQALGAVIDALRAKGFTLVTLPAVL